MCDCLPLCLRLLHRNPKFYLLALLVIFLGIGSTTAIFSLITASRAGKKKLRFAGFWMVRVGEVQGQRDDLASGSSALLVEGHSLSIGCEGPCGHRADRLTVSADGRVQSYCWTNANWSRPLRPATVFF
jgi:hypothetical protein